MKIADFNRLFGKVLTRLPATARKAVINFWHRAPAIDPLTAEHGTLPFVHVVKGLKRMCGLGRLVREHLGADILVAVQSRPAWASTIDAVRQRLACRSERRAA